MPRTSRAALVAGAFLIGCGSSTPPPQIEPTAAAKTETSQLDRQLSIVAEGILALDGLGDQQRKITTTSSVAQAFFDQGLRLVWAFNHEEAARAFARAALADRSCAMCLWGVSFALGPNYNMSMMPEVTGLAFEAGARATELAKTSGTEVERALIAAVAKRYGGPKPVDAAAQQALNETYAQMMREAAKANPDDLDVQVLLADALMNLRPWKLWTTSGDPEPGTEELVGIIEAALAKDPNHVGANHLYIHATEASKDPGRAVEAAKRIPTLAPGAPHLVHMPAHVYVRLGRYEDSADANRKALAVDKEYLERAQPKGHYGAMYYAHNYFFLAYSAAMAGKSAEAIKAARDGAEHITPHTIMAMPFMEFFIAIPDVMLVRFGKWEQILAQPAPDPAKKTIVALRAYARGMAQHGMGKTKEAEAELEALKAAKAEVPADYPAGFNGAHDIMGIAQLELEAALATKKGEHARAVTLLEEAVRKEDALAYDEPPNWWFPVRHLLGAALLAAKQPDKAEAVYREDLKKHPNNGWATLGLSQALSAQKKNKKKKAEAAKVMKEFEKLWSGADMKPRSSAH